MVKPLNHAVEIYEYRQRIDTGHLQLGKMTKKIANIDPEACDGLYSAARQADLSLATNCREYEYKSG